MSEANEPDRVLWRKSSTSLSGECIEVAGSRSTVFVRDSKDRDGPTLAFPGDAWRTFVSGLVRRT